MQDTNKLQAYKKTRRKLSDLVCCFIMGFIGFIHIGISPIFGIIFFSLGLIGLIISFNELANPSKAAIIITYEGISDGTDFVAWKDVKAINYKHYNNGMQELEIKYLNHKLQRKEISIYIDDLTESSSSIQYAISRFSGIQWQYGRIYTG
ncbi:hypothetical protein PN471_00625 [Aphanizomenon sp. CS-733/32]|uniref:hypothetical protein n=1 Tax=Aphanizomenon sp. CS-733/32 TaxID=3021715 RepID=UPI002330149B|nr:hypothetical protein [Aphanizomenon sp. CS-733/32]MDB9307188.1 hypothetical protein [Aphanizomenon sp. CS-733/32]